MKQQFDIPIYKKLYPLEREILSLIIDNSPDEIKAKWERQLKAMNKVQRIGNEISFYRIKWLKASICGLEPIDQFDPENVSSFLFQLDHLRVSVEASFVKGVFFSLIFDRDIKKLAAGRNLVMITAKYLRDRSGTFPDKEAADYIDKFQAAFLDMDNLQIREDRSLINIDDTNYTIIAEIVGVGAFCVPQAEKRVVFYFYENENCIVVADEANLFYDKIKQILKGG